MTVRPNRAEYTPAKPYRAEYMQNETTQGF
jgi:hypothetical protein